MTNFNKLFLATLGLGLFVSQAAHAQLGVGYGNTTPRTMLDVNGAVAVAETSVAVSGNAATIPTNVSQVQLTGTPTATIALTSAATPAPVAGQHVVVYNTTAQAATFNSQNIPAGQSVMFVYSNGGFRATGGGGNAFSADNGLNKNTGSNVRLGGNLVTATTVTNNGNALNIAGSGSTTTFDAAGNVGVGTAPSANLHVLNKGAGGTGVFNTNTANTALRLDANSNAQSVIQYFTTKNTAGTTKEFLLGINPTFNTERGIFYMGRTGNANDMVMDLTTGFVGIGSGNPQSSLEVNGSLAANYKSVTATGTTALAATDFYVVYSGSGAATLTLPSATGVKGRLVNIKNTTAAQMVTVNTSNSETIDGAATITIPAGQSVQVVTTGATGTATYEIVNFNAATAAGPAGVVTTANNGLTKTSNNIQLGGNLTQATAITNNGFDLTAVGSGSTTTFASNGNVGIGTTPSVSLHVLNKGTGGTGVFSTNTANMGLRLEGNGNGQSIIEQFVAKDASGTAKGFLLGINPTFNTSTGTANTNGLFYIGRTGNSDVAVDLGTGYVGIGTSTPINPLSVTGTANVTDRASFGNGVNIQGTGQSAMTVTSTNAAIAGTPILANTAGNFYYDASGRETHVFGGDIAPDATSGRDLGLSTARWSTLYVTSINNTNAPSNSSDIRLKKDIKPTTYGLQEVLRMRPVSYRWKQDLDNVGVMLGFIAQEMDTIIPESVTKPKTDKDFYGIRYTELIPVLTKAIQEQQTEIDALKAANAKLASDNTALKAGLDSKASASTVNELQAALQAMRAEMQTLKAGGSTASAK